MPSDWQSCPHCRVRFVPRPGPAGGTCPACGKPLAARPKAPAGWYHALGGQRTGPLTAGQLRELAASGRLSPADWVWREGLPDWVPAGKVKGLFPAPAPPAALPALAPCSAAPCAAAPGSAAPCAAPGTDAFASRHEALSEAQVVPDAERCVQCGICSYNCPIGIDVRAHAWRGLPVHDSHCLTCSECVKRCPRGVLSFERIPLFTV